MNWHKLETLSDYNNMVDASNEESYAVAVFKHSTRCPVSMMAKLKLSTTWDIDENRVPLYYLDLIKYREISNQIAADFDVQHESPQLLVLKNNKCLYHASHGSISVSEVKEVLEIKD
ncbi:MAG: bacillithiol system redox-active protein YtxJ [Vicingaceae bacterium]|nr:bacillithiol system redox-active protein YtxJ [Vicingaceae bacterium]